jgi:rod shape-determining protein MreC
VSGTKSKLVILFLLPLALYLGLYSVNQRTGFLDRLASTTGLEIVGWIVTPGNWIRQTSQGLWRDYVALWGVRQENRELRQQAQKLRIRLMRLKSQAAEAERLRDLLEFSPPPDWNCTGARIVGERLTPSDTLQTVIVDKGQSDAVHPGMPALTPSGLVGQVLKTSPNFSKLLLITDPNSKIPVIGRQDRTKAILKGTGAGPDLKLDYVTRNTSISEGEIVVTSGLGGFFPKGIPVGRITRAVQTKHTLFQVVEAEPIADLRRREEVLLLHQSGKTLMDTPLFDPASLINLE